MSPIPLGILAGSVGSSGSSYLLYSSNLRFSQKGVYDQSDESWVIPTTDQIDNTLHVAKMSKSGAILQTKNIPVAASGDPTDIKIGPDGSYWIPNRTDTIINISSDLSTYKEYTLSGSRSFSAYDLDFDTSGNIVVSGSAYGNYGRSMFCSFSPSGTANWARELVGEIATSSSEIPKLGTPNGVDFYGAATMRYSQSRSQCRFIHINSSGEIEKGGKIGSSEGFPGKSAVSFSGNNVFFTTSDANSNARTLVVNKDWSTSTNRTIYAEALYPIPTGGTLVSAMKNDNFSSFQLGGDPGRSIGIGAYGGIRVYEDGNLYLSRLGENHALTSNVVTLPNVGSSATLGSRSLNFMEYTGSTSVLTTGAMNDGSFSTYNITLTVSVSSALAAPDSSATIETKRFS